LDYVLLVVKCNKQLGCIDYWFLTFSLLVTAPAVG
jgi:hypothetical protein